MPELPHTNMSSTNLNVTEMSTSDKLANDAFLAKAPTAEVDKIRARQQLARDEVDRITSRLAAM